MIISRVRLHTLLSLGALALIAIYLTQACTHLAAARLLPLAFALAGVYVLCHLARGLRLFLLLYDGRVRLRDVLLAHLRAAGVSSLIPFKIGELYRIAVLDGLIRDPARALLTVWIERAYDMLFVTAGLVLLMLRAGPAQAAPYAWFFVGAVTFLVLSFVLFLVLPENVNALKRYLILRHNSTAALRALRAVHTLHGHLRTAAKLWRYRWATMLWLTLGIWLGELAILYAVVGLAGGGPGLALDIFHTITLRSSPWNDPATVLAAAPPGVDAAAIVATYRVATVDALALIAGVLLLLPLVARLRPSPPSLMEQAR